MFSTPFLFRIAKVISAGAIGIMSLFVFIGNTTDYCTNYMFVEHVLKMDTISPNSALQYRSINSVPIYHTAYIIIITLEACMAFCCLKGVFLLLKNLKSSTEIFHASKNWVIAAIIIGIIIWFLGFEVIGGEWFAMWQSHSWNGLNSAERIVTFLALALILLQFKEE